jgi:hypothetical protein
MGGVSRAVKHLAEYSKRLIDEVVDGDELVIRKPITPPSRARSGPDVHMCS